jgi:hypothetical protein
MACTEEQLATDEWPPRRKPGFEKRQVGSIRQRSGLVWLPGRSCGTSHAGDITAVNSKTMDFSPLSELLVATANLDL